MLLIPYGKVLILPGDTVHGGGFQLDFRTEDLRIHFYLYIKPAAPGRFRENIYLSEDDYPMHEGLHDSEILWRAFLSDKGT